MNKTSAKFLLTAVFIARGTSFLFSKTLMDSMSPMSILAVRFILAFLVLAIIFFKKLRFCSKTSFLSGLLLGTLYTITMIFEMFGLKRIDSGVSALIENMAIVIVPLFIAIITKTPPKLKTVICALMAVIGVGFLSLTQLNISGGLLGVFLMIGAALCYAICIITTGKVVEKADPITVGIIQLGTMGVLSFIVSLCTGSFALPQTGNQWIMLLILVLVCSCFGFTFQPVGQKYVSAETAAVFTVVNPLTASLLGILVRGEPMSVFKAIGYALILGALFLYNLNNK